MSIPESPSSNEPIPEAIAVAAAEWLARRDRGLSSAEQDDYTQWLAADPRHAVALTQHAATLERMMQLHEWTPAYDTGPNPDLFAPLPGKTGRRGWLWAAGLAAAAAVVVGAFQFGGHRANLAANVVAAAPQPNSYLRVNERMALPDGSRVELRDGSRVVVQYSDGERRVKLIGGEAHFSVWKDPSRPFVVDAAGVEVHAVGTAFDVRLDPAAVEVLVTEGRVKVDVPERRATAAVGWAPSFVAMNERAIVSLTAEQPVPVVTSVPVEDIARELAWQAPRLQFHETPLREAVAEFNRLNRHQLVLGEPGLGELRIGGTFRPDNVDGFIRLLDTTLGVHAVADGDNRTLLMRGR